MPAAAAPRLTGGMVASGMLHAAAIAALFIFRPGAPRPSPPIYRVQIFAAPAGERAAGVVGDKPQTTPAPPPAPIPKTTRTKPVPQKAVPVQPTKSTPTPQVATPTPSTTPADQSKSVAPAPVAGGGPTGGKGADVANVVTDGIDFPYPSYINNITSSILRQFHTTARLTAVVQFIIRRDGSVDLNGIRLLTSSHNYVFDQQALGAVEAAAKVFGPLPPGYREDILAVTFRFNPSLLK